VDPAAPEYAAVRAVGRCRLTLSNSRRKRPNKRLKLRYDYLPSNFAFKFNLNCYIAVLLDPSCSGSGTAGTRGAGAYTRPLFGST
jgi:16S rRNA C967 or C1407 C5-methylase (RsmB/RsmF family)